MLPPGVAEAKTASALPEVWQTVVEAFEEAGVLPIVEYIHVRQMRIANYVATRPIYELCRNATWRPGSARRTLWWTQPKLQDHLASL